MYRFIFYILITHFAISGTSQILYRTNTANIHFVSDAPLEFIQAASDKCQGILNIESGEFAFRVYIKSFDGFNSPLQRVHFYENYMEVNQFPDATFAGKMVENIEPGKQEYRAKGILKIHGVENEILVNVTLIPDGGGFSFLAAFEIALIDYDIEIPAIVRQKIAEKIKIEVKGILAEWKM